MKKPLIAILLAAIVMLSCSCTENQTNDAQKQDSSAQTTTANNDETAKDTSSDTEETPSAKNSDTAFEIVLGDGTKIALGAEAESIINSLPDPLDVTEAPNCVREGTDRIYTFNGFTVTTNPDESGADRVINVTLINDACVLENRITIGSTVKDLEKAYGTEHEDNFGVLTYKLENGVTLSAVIADDIVTSLTFSVEI